MPPASSVEREEARRLNVRTLSIASTASAAAAAVTSQLWIAGTWIAAALTPVLVALISEAMHRPTERIARAWTSERDTPGSRAGTATRAEPSAVTGTAGPVRVYRQTTRGVEQTRGVAGRGVEQRGVAGRGGPRADATARGASARTLLARPTAFSRRRIAIGTVAATAAIAFVVGIVALTTADLVTGGSVGKGSGRTTLLSGGGTSGDERQNEQGRDSTRQQPDQQQDGQQQAPDRQQPAPTDEPTTTEPAPDEQPPSDTVPVPPPTNTPPGEPVPQSTP